MADTFTGTAGTVNDGVYRQEWESKLQERLNYPQNWKEICNVIYTNSRYVNVPYMSTLPVTTGVGVGTRGTAYAYQDFAMTNQAMSIGTTTIVPMYVDRADMAQCAYLNQMEMASLQATLINEAIETAVLAAAISATNVGDTGGGAIGLGSTAITVSASNIDDIIRGVRRLITKYNGQDLAGRNGIFFVWRPEDFELLEAFVQANGFTSADTALKNGAVAGLHYMGVDHYVSNSTDTTTNGHIFAGVKKLMTVGILGETYGKVVVNQDPGQKSGIGVVTRGDYGTLIPTNYLPVLFDINVTAI